jgi:hypothetical protein
MATVSVPTVDFANQSTDKTAPSSRRCGPTHFSVVNKIKDLYAKDTVKILAGWLKVSIDTAKHRIKGDREFSLDEIAELLHSEHGFEILTALMAGAKRQPQWWRVCMPLMDLADAERMVAVVRKRTQDAITKREEVTDALETEIRRAQTLAIHGSEQAGVHLDALRSLALAPHRVVAPGRRG